MVASTFGIMIVNQVESVTEKRRSLGDQITPTVKLMLADDDKRGAWNSQIRYQIEVRDPIDGNSTYGEINSQQVFLSIRLFPNAVDSAAFAHPEEQNRLTDHSGLTLMGKGGCFSCHADENSITGPSFSEIAVAYSKGKRSKQDQVQSILKGSEGQWGNMAMPAHPEFTEGEAIKMVEYIIRQGTCEHCWVYTGLEGVLKIIEAPEHIDAGLFLLTASYTSSNGEEGKDSIALKVR